MEKIITLIMPNTEVYPVHKDNIANLYHKLMMSILQEGCVLIGVTHKFEKFGNQLKDLSEAAAPLMMDHLHEYAKTHEVIKADAYMDIYGAFIAEIIASHKPEESPYAAVPTEASKLTAAFAAGLKKQLSPTRAEKTVEGWREGKTYIFFSLDEKQTKTTIQYSLFDDADVTELQSYEKTLQGTLGPYGLKVFYSLLAQCDDNERQHWFYLNINKTLDRMGHKRDSKGRHDTQSRERYIKAIEDLSKVKWNIESRSPDPKNKKNIIVKRIRGPLINITAEVDSYKIGTDNPDNIKSKIVRDGMKIIIEPVLFEEMDTRFTKFPRAYLAIDANRKPYQIILYPFINHQFRYGWAKNKGIIKLSLANIIRRSGIPIPARSDYKLDVVKKVINSLIEMKDNKELWIEDIKFTKPAKPVSTKSKEVETLLAQIVTITASQNHPVRELGNNISLLTDKIQDRSS